MSHKPTLALVAHDHKKDALADFVLDNRKAFGRFHLVATHGTGSLIHKRTGLILHLLEHGPAGGDQELGELVSHNEVQAVIFFRDPLTAGPHEPDFADLLKVCDTQEIPLATNRATAQAILFFLQNSPDSGIIAARPWGFAPAAASSKGELA